MSVMLSMSEMEQLSRKNAMNYFMVSELSTSFSVNNSQLPFQSSQIEEKSVINHHR